MIKQTQDMSVEEILKSIRSIINHHETTHLEHEEIGEDIFELTEVVDATGEVAKSLTADNRQSTSTSDLVDRLVIEETASSLRQFVDKAKLACKEHNRLQTLTVEELVAQMMRPQLKEWLDKNLPILVKELVEKEITRLILAIDKK